MTAYLVTTTAPYPDYGSSENWWVHSPANLCPADATLWAHVTVLAADQSWLMDQTFCYLTREEFHAIAHHFIPEIRSGHYRTPRRWHHLHAVDEGDRINIHIDIANPMAGGLMMVAHFMLDVVTTGVAASLRYRRPCLRPFFKEA